MSYHFIGYLIIGIVIIGGVIRWLMNHLTFLRLYKQGSKFHGPPGLPILGNALNFMGNGEDMLNMIAELSRLYPSPYRVWIGPQLVIFTTKPEHIKIVLNSEKAIEKSQLYRFFEPWVGYGLFTAPAAIWRAHRKLIGPTFNLKILESFVSVFAVQGKLLADKMEKEVNGTEFEIFDDLSLCTLDIICETAMGLTMEAQTKSDRTYINAVQNSFSTINKRILKFWLHPDVIFNRTQLGKDFKQTVEALHCFTDHVIYKKTKTFFDKNSRESTIDQKDNSCATVPDVSLPPKRQAYLDLLIGLTHNELKLSHQELRAEVDTMIVAGTDTSSHTISFVMLMLASHQDVQDKVYQELHQIYGGSDIDERNVTHEDLPRMEYLERVIKETLRLFPITVFISRLVTEDLDMDEYTLPKGCAAAVGIAAVHRNEEYWTDPLKFDPDRFLPEEIAKRHPYCYLPFSAGPRNCIGVRFAMLEMKTILATVIRRYCLKKDNVVPVSDIRLKTETLIKPVDPITLRIERRLPKAH